MSKIKFTDRRQDADPVSDDERVAVEDDRQRKRAAIRAEAAKLQFEKDKIPPLEAIIAESHARVEEATVSHQIICGPLQAELETLEAQAIARVTSRKTSDPEADARRIELLRELADANAELEKTVELEKAARAPMEREVWRLRNHVSDPKAVLGKLAQPPLVSPELHAQSFVMRQRTEWLRARQNTAEKKLKTCKYNLAEISAGRMSGSAPDWVARVAAWEREVHAVTGEIQDALTASDELHLAKLNE